MQTDGEVLAPLSQHPQCPEGLFFGPSSMSILGSRALLCNFKHFLLSKSAQPFATLCCPHVRPDFNDCLFFCPCSLSSFPSSFHIFGCDPAEPSDSLLLNAAAHQSTPGSNNSSMLLPGINNFRRGTLQTTPVLKADKISNLASQQCSISPCCSLCCRHPSPHTHSLTS